MLPAIFFAGFYFGENRRDREYVKMEERVQILTQENAHLRSKQAKLELVMKRMENEKFKVDSLNGSNASKER